MAHTYLHLGRRSLRAGIAAASAAVLITGATWIGMAAGAGAPAAQAVSSTPAPQISRSIAAGHDSYADIVKVVSPAVVTIRTEGKAKVSPTDLPGDDFFRQFFGNRGPFEPGQFAPGQPGRGPRQQPRTFKQRALGSGVIVSNDGYLLTNNHVVDGADDIKVETTDGATFTAKVVGSDKPSDLALLKIDAKNLHPLALGNSDAVEVGDVVLAVGNPLGLGQTVTMGIISAKGRATDGGDTYEDFLQTDAPINHGNSGGALVNTRGELVGINSQIASVSDGNIGIGFAIPANMAKRVMTDLKDGGLVHRARMGVSIQQVTPEMAESLGLTSASGAIVSSVESGSAAERAGIKRNDIIKSFNGQPVQDINSLRNRVADLAPGSNATVVVERDGKERSVSVKLDAAAPAQSARGADDGASDDSKGTLGVSVAPLTPELASRAGISKDAHGVLVEIVDPDGGAAEAGIQAGDVIEEVNRQPVKTVDELRAAVRSAANKPVLLLVNREGRDIFVTVKAS